MATKMVILFDGVCYFCNRAVRFIIKRDPKARFVFASLQSPIGQKLLQHYGLPTTLNSMVLIQGERYFLRSDAALKIASHLAGFYRLLGIFWIVPRFVRDIFYNLVARNRYKWWGKLDSCPIPTAEEKSRFLNEKKDLEDLKVYLQTSTKEKSYGHLPT
ncbi:MAG: thiol-disulfide oxidoreductase DCC family protein [Planctomycetota bacterium]|nr:MAG: thiol-disulfide oxidoreductase DCC family protein [Planctomycetota bacterium]